MGILGNHGDIMPVVTLGLDDIRIVVTLGHHGDIMTLVTLGPW